LLSSTPFGTGGLRITVTRRLLEAAPDGKIEVALAEAAKNVTIEIRFEFLGQHG